MRLQNACMNVNCVGRADFCLAKEEEEQQEGKEPQVSPVAPHTEGK